MPQPSTYNTDINDYTEFYQYYLDKTGYEQLWQDNIDHDVFPRIPEILKKDTIRILSVGAGPGAPDRLLLKSLDSFASSNQRSINVSYTAIEPLPDNCLRLHRNLARIVKDVTNLNISLNFNPGRLENFLPSNSGSFDLVLMLHSLYHMDVPVVLRECYNILNENGCLILLAASDIPSLTTVAMIIRELSEEIEGSHNEITWTTRERMLSTFKEEGWKFWQHTRGYETEFTDIFDENSVHGQTLIEFLALVKDMKKKAGKEKWNSMLESIKKHLHAKDDNKLVADLADELTVVWKK